MTISANGTWLAEAFRRLLLAMSVLLLGVSSAHGQSYGAPTYAVGDTWKRNVDGKTVEVKVVTVEENATAFSEGRADCPTCLSLMDKNLALLRLTTADGKDVDVTRISFIATGHEWRVLDFPLEVGKAWRISSHAYLNGSPENYEVDCRVVKYEDVKTPAGTFKAFRVRCDWIFKHRSGYDAHWTNDNWFAPEVKHVVKFTSTRRGAVSWDLVSYELKRD